MACKYKYKDNWYSKEELKSILLKERGISPDGKLEKPEIERKIVKSEEVYELRWKNGNVIRRYQSLEDAKAAQIGEYTDSKGNKISKEEATEIIKGNPIEVIGKQPTQTIENTTSIESVKNKILKKNFISHEVTNADRIKWLEDKATNNKYEENENNRWEKIEGRWFKVKEFGQNQILPIYENQALINLKIAALKEVARKYPRSLITSKVVPINSNMVDNSEIQYSKIINPNEVNYSSILLQANDIKPGVPELFESNPELANSVYSTDKEESEYYSEYNKNDENSNNLQSTESILETNPKLKKFIEDITDEDGSISLFKYNKIINDKEKFGNLPVMKTITKLNNILKNAVNRLWDNRINAENNLKIKFVESLEDEDAVAQFLRKENEIHISKNIFLNILDKDFKDYPEFYTGYLLNHELIHYLTPQSLSTKPQFIDRLLLNEKSDMYLKNLYEREFVKNIKNLYNFSISQLEDLSDYGFTNLAEFVTEAMSNPRFQVKLSTIKYKNENKSLWKKFIKILSDYLSSITGNSIEDTVLEAVISEVTNYITENSNIERTYKTKINNSGDTQFYFVFNKNSEIGIEQEEINNYDNSDNENFEFNEDLTGNEYIENIDNKYLIKFEELLNKGVITQICN